MLKCGDGLNINAVDTGENYMDLTKDAPDADDMASDPVGASADGVRFGAGVGIMLTFALLGYQLVAQPAVSLIGGLVGNVSNAVSNAAENNADVDPDDFY